MNRRKFFGLLAGLVTAPVITNRKGYCINLPGTDSPNFTHLLPPFEYYNIRGIGYKLYEIHNNQFTGWSNL